MLQVTDPNSANTWSGERKYIFTQSFGLCMAFVMFAVAVPWQGNRRVTCQPLPYQQVVLCLWGASVGPCWCLSVTSYGGHEFVPHLVLGSSGQSWCVWHLPSTFLPPWLILKCCSSFVSCPPTPSLFHFNSEPLFLFSSVFLFFCSFFFM